MLTDQGCILDVAFTVSRRYSSHQLGPPEPYNWSQSRGALSIDKKLGHQLTTVYYAGIKPFLADKQ
jgi:hypothetical protein